MPKTFISRNERALAIVVLVLFGALFAVESIGNHWMFRTFGLDLGLYNKTLFDHAHLRDNDGTFFMDTPSSQMGGHFDLYLWLFSPLMYVFGEYTLLLVQIASVMCAMWGVYRLTKQYVESPAASLAAMLMLGLSFGLWHALAFDYHSNVVSASLLPWLLYYAKRTKPLGVVVMAAAMAMAGELSALWVFFVLAALTADYWKERRMRWVLLAVAGSVLVYSLVLILVVMPALGGGGGTGFWRYSWMGSGVGEAMLWLVGHPFEAAAAFFGDFTGSAPGLKTEFCICLLLSGGLLCLAKPNYLIMFLPAIVVKMLARDPFAFWTVANHYNVEICMVSACVAGPSLSRFKSRRAQRGVSVAGVVCSALVLLYTVGTPRAFILPDNVRVFSPRHYRQDAFDADFARQVMRQIPKDASVCASTMFTPHLALRDSVYLFPSGMDNSPEYVMLLFGDNAADDARLAAEAIDDTVRYRVVDTDGIVYLLRRN